jgi:hypothetical protein
MSFVLWRIGQLVAATALWSAVLCSAYAREGYLLPNEDRALMVAISGDRVTFTWMARPGRIYDILRVDRTNRQRGRPTPAPAPVPGLVRIEGTGRRETHTVIIPNAGQYVYSLHSYDAARKPPVRARR